MIVVDVAHLSILKDEILNKYLILCFDSDIVPCYGGIVPPTNSLLNIVIWWNLTFWTFLNQIRRIWDYLPQYILFPFGFVHN
jgi:hypothetical protein